VNASLRPGESSTPADFLLLVSKPLHSEAALSRGLRSLLPFVPPKREFHVVSIARIRSNGRGKVNNLRQHRR
jgi:hypothetical protein